MGILWEYYGNMIIGAFVGIWWEYVSGSYKISQMLSRIGSLGKSTIESLFIKRPKFVSDVASIQMFRLTNTPICVLGKYE